MRTFILMVMLVVSGWAQNTNNQVVLNTGAPVGVNTVSARIVGNQGSNTFYYWVVARFVSGQSPASPSVIVRNAPTPTSGNSIVITWSAVSGASSYDVLRTTTATLANPCTCSLVTGQSTTSYSDIGGSLSSYTLTPVGGTTGTITLDNGGFSIPRFLMNRPINPTLFANLPSAASSNGLSYLVTDSVAFNSCTAGGGTSTPAICWSNGTTWVAIGGSGGGGMVYPGAGVANSTGAAWTTSYTVGVSPNNLVQLDGSGNIPTGVGIPGLSGLVAGNLPVATSPTVVTDSGIAAADVQLKGSSTVNPPPSSQGNGDFWVVRTNTTTLTIGGSCSVTFPCKIAFGTTVYSLTTPATATIASGSDTAYIYVSSSQVLTVGTASQTVTCSGCTAVTGVSAFPGDSFPLWNWTSTSGTWDVGSGTDGRTIVQKGADPLGRYLISTADSQLKNAVNLGALTAGILRIAVSGGIATPSSAELSGAVTTNGSNVTTTTFSCQPGLGDGNNAISAGTYLQTGCLNKFGSTYTITAVNCLTDNAGSSTLNITNGAGTALLTGAITCNATLPGAAGTQSGTITIANTDGVKFTFVSDGTTKTTTWSVTGTR